MGIIAAISNAQTSLPPDVTSRTEVLVTISLVVSLAIALLTSDSRYWNRWSSSTLQTCAYPLLITFAGILIYKIMRIL